MSNISAPTGTSPGFIDAAETFSESDVTLSGTNQSVSAESVVIGDKTQSPSLPSLGSKGAAYLFAGIRFTPNESITGIDVNWADAGTIVDEAQIRLTSDNSVVHTTYGESGGSSSFDLSGNPLSVGTEYAIGLYDSGDSIDADYADSDPSTTGPLVDVTGGYTDGGFDGNGGNRTWLVNSITFKSANSSATAYVEWPEPPDVYAWDQAVYDRALDGETVDVYIEEDDGSGWTTIAGPIGRGEPITASATSKVRFRVEISRSNNSNSPALESIYRRYTV